MKTHDKVGELLDEVKTLSRSLRQETHFSERTSEYRNVEKMFVYLQILSACFVAFAHGANDVANAIGPVAAVLDIIKNGQISEVASIPPWLLAFGGIGIVIGLATWGWRVIETIGKKITEFTPTRGFCAEFGAATTILIASKLGMPISTTHCLVGAVFGVGLATRDARFKPQHHPRHHPLLGDHHSCKRCHEHLYFLCFARHLHLRLI